VIAPVPNAKPATIRAFVAVDLDADGLRHAVRIADRLRRASEAPRATWVTAERMHVTLKFAGQLPLDAVGPLGSALAGVASAWTAPHAVSLRLDAFPALRDARTVVLALDDTGGRLAELAHSVDSLLSAHGVPSEGRPFRPHITLARLKHSLDARPWLGRGPDVTVGSCNLAALTLYRSDTLPDGPRYTSLTRIALSADPE
jgi:2'-5' RNA ligase